MAKLSTMTDIQVRVLEAIKRYGSKKLPLSRERLAELTGHPDRVCRLAIERLCKNFEIRIETHIEGGYYIPRKGAKHSIGRRLFRQAISLLMTARKLCNLTDEEVMDEIQMKLFSPLLVEGCEGSRDRQKPEEAKG